VKCGFPFQNFPNFFKFERKTKMRNFRQEGKNMDWVNGTGTDVKSGDVVLFPFGAGIAAVDIPDGGTGVVTVEGVFRLPKKAATAIAQGAVVYWDATPGEVTTTGGDGVAIGYAFVGALAAAAHVDVKLREFAADAT
jgi:predicted RecA/RadA family phage recombinase